jgi:hypothetical protein
MSCLLGSREPYTVIAGPPHVDRQINLSTRLDGIHGHGEKKKPETEA